LEPLPDDLVNILRKQLRTDGPVFSATNLRKAFEYGAVEVGLVVWRDPEDPYYGGNNIVDETDIVEAMRKVQDSKNLVGRQ
jgi:hypothetical protein